MLVLIVAYAGNTAYELGAASSELDDGTLDSPFGAALALAGVALAWWVWTLYRRLERRDRLARTQATAVHATAAAVWGLPLLILVVGLASGEATGISGSDAGAIVRDTVIVAANLFVVVALRAAKDCTRELAVPAAAAALAFEGFEVDARDVRGRAADGSVVGLVAPPPARRNWTLAPAVVRAASLCFVALAVVHAAALVLSFRGCDDCASGQLLGTLTALLLSPFVVIACAGAILVAIGVVRRWKSTRSVGVLLAAVFGLTAPVIDQLVFGGIESSLRNGARAVWNGELAFLVSAANVAIMVLLTRPAARGWEMTRERAIQAVPARVTRPVDGRPPQAQPQPQPAAPGHHGAAAPARRVRHRRHVAVDDTANHR